MYLLTERIKMNACGEFSLKWNSYQSQVMTAFSSFKSSENMVDVTLQCDDGKLGAHKLLLAACSPYFKQVFSNSPCHCSHPLIVFRNVRYSDLCAVITFMYRGEVKVPQEHLASFLTTAELLEVRGLTDDQTLEPVPDTAPPQDPLLLAQKSARVPVEPTETETPRETEVKTKKKKLNPEKNETHKESLKQEVTEHDEDEDATEPNSPSHNTQTYENYAPEVSELKDAEKPPDNNIPSDLAGNETRDNNTQGADNTDKYDIVTDNDNMWKIQFDDEKPYSCTQCRKSFKHPMSLRQHLKIHSGKTKCEYCAKVLSRVRDLQIHKNLIHGINT